MRHWNLTVLALTATTLLVLKSLGHYPLTAQASNHDHGHSTTSALAPHVHGEAQLTLAVEARGVLNLVLQAPGQVILGFEHEATTEQDKTIQSEALAKLESNLLRNLGFPRGVSCTVSDFESEIKFSSHDHKTEHKHDHKHSHGDKKEPKSGHSDVIMSASLDCGDLSDGTRLSLNFGQDLPNLEKLNVIVVKDDSQDKSEVSKGRGRIRL